MTRRFHSFNAFLAAGVLTGALLAAPPARGAEMSATSDGILIRYAPSELDNSLDAQNLYHKLKFAAREVCHSGATLRSLSERVQAERCYEKVLSSVIQKINRPVLSSLHASELDKVG